LQSGKLNEDPVRALPRDGRFRHAELVDAVANRLQTLPDGVVGEAARLPIAHGHRESPGRLVLAAALERLELGSHRLRVVPRLRRGQLDAERQAGRMRAQAKKTA